MYWGWGAQIVPSVGRQRGCWLGGSAQGSSFLFLQVAGKSPAHRCRFRSFSAWISRTVGSPWARRSCSTARRRAAVPSCSCCWSPHARWSVGFSGRGPWGGTMSPSQTRRSLILWWKVKVIRAARNAIVAPTNAEVNSNARSNISLFIGG